MSYGRAGRRTIHRARIRKGRVAALLVAVAVAAALGDQVLATPHSPEPSPRAVPARERRDPPRAGGLDPALEGAVRRAAGDAAGEGVVIRIDSGWRSPAHQQRLLDAAIVKYGSEQEAARWVAPPTRSAHVAGNAVDVGPPAAAAWLSRHGAAYGLCQVYANEPWHYELRPEAAVDGCPPLYADPTEDPRMEQP